MRDKLDKIPMPEGDLPTADSVVGRPTIERVRSSRPRSTRSRSIAFDNAVLMNMGEGMYTVDANGLVTSMNPTAEILFGWTFEELAGRNMHNVTHHLHRDGTPFPAEECAGSQVLQHGRSIKDHDDVFIRKDGSFFDVIYSSSPLREDGEIKGLVVVFRDVTERNETLTALRESEESYRILTETASDAIIRIDAGSIIQFVNAAATRIFGYCEAEMTGQSLMMLMPEAMREQHRKGFERYLTSGERKLNWASIEVSARHKDGREFPLEISFGEYVQNRTRFFIGVARDITQRKQTERQIRDSEERFAKAFNSSPLALTISSLETGKIIEINQTFENVSGFTRDEAIGKTTIELGLWANAEDREREIETVKKTGEIRNVEYRFRVKDGREVIGLLSAESIEVGGEPCALTVIQDITERSHAEKKLRESEERFRDLADNISQLAWMMDADGWIFWYNQRWYDYTGTTLEEMQGWGWQAVHHPDHVGRVTEYFKKFIASGEEWEDTFPLRGKDGEYRWFLSRAMPIRDDDGKIVRWFGTNTDITERNAAEKSLRESELRYSLAQEAGNVGVWDWNVATGRTYWSETMWRIYGSNRYETDPDEAFWLSHIHPDDRDRAKLSIEAGLESADDRHTDMFRIVQKGGGIKWIESNATIQRDDSGKPVRMYGVDIDITDKKSTEERIRRRETQLRLITNSVPGLISYIDKDRRFRFVNHQYTEWFGHPENEIIGQHMRDLLGVKTYKIVQPKVDQVLAGETCSIETLIHYPKAGSRFVQLSYTPDFAEDGTVRGFYVLVTDLTERKLAEDQLRTSEERMRVLMWSLTEHAILSINLEGKIEAWNRGAELIFGYEKDEILGCHIEKLFTPEDVGKGQHIKEMRASRQKGHAADDRWHVRKDGSRFFASGEMTPVYVGRKLIGYAKIVRDLTETKRVADELKQAHDELEIRVEERTEELIGTNAKLLAQMNERALAEASSLRLMRRILTVQEDERGRIARDIHDQLGQRLTALRLKIASLRDISSEHPVILGRVNRLQEIAEHLDTEVSFLAWELRPSVLDDVEFTKALGNYVSEWSRHSEIFAEFDTIGLKDVELGADIENNLYRITQEALNNAAKHANADRITVLLEKRENEVLLIIEDNGVGFDPHRIDADRDASKGFGLHGMRERASIISGKIEIETSKNNGTSIFVRVPLA